MKKIALLLTIVCTSQLYTMKRIYGMEPEPSYETLPPELKQEIINTALATNKKLSKKIEMIKNLSALHGVQYDNLKDFTTLVHILNKELKVTTARIAMKFNTPTAEKYLMLGHNLSEAVRLDTQAAHDKIADLIKEGADVNFIDYNYVFPLHRAMWLLNTEGVNLLLNARANPQSLLHFIPSFLQEKRNKESGEKALVIKNLLEEAIKKYPQKK